MFQRKHKISSSSSLVSAHVEVIRDVFHGVLSNVNEGSNANDSRGHKWQVMVRPAVTGATVAEDIVALQPVIMITPHLLSRLEAGASFQTVPARSLTR